MVVRERTAGFSLDQERPGKTRKCEEREMLEAGRQTATLGYLYIRAQVFT